VELATVLDRLAVDAVITAYAVAVDDADWPAYEALFTEDGRADYRSAGGIEGTAREVCGWLAGMLELFPVRQHLIVNRRLRLAELDGNTGDSAQLQADYLNPMRLERAEGAANDPSAPNFVTGGRYAFTLLRSGDGDGDDAHGAWRVHRVTVHEKWRRTGPGAGVV
jgi:hypothetical protein